MYLNVSLEVLRAGGLQGLTEVELTFRKSFQCLIGRQKSAANVHLTDLFVDGLYKVGCRKT